MKKRFVSILLCLVLLLSVLPFSADAASISVYTVSCDQGVYYGGTYDIVIGASGTNLKYQWQAYGLKWIDLEDNAAYSGTNTPHLVFHPGTDFVDGGSDWSIVGFRCVVTGDEGKGYSPTYHMYLYSQKDLLVRLENDPVYISRVVHNAILPNPPEEPIAPEIYHVYAVAGEELHFDFDCTPLKQWMLDSEISRGTYVQLIDENGMHVYSGTDSVTFTPTKIGEKSVIVSLNMKLQIGGKDFGYSDSNSFIITVKQPEVIGTATVSASALNVRSEPATDSDRIGGLTMGDTVSLVRRVGDWYRILYGNRVGYVLASGLNFGGTSETRGKVTDVSLSGIDIPVVGQNCDVDFMINGNVEVSELQWWWDQTGNGAADEENCTVFKEGGQYYCRVRLKAAEGYYFPTEKTIVNGRPAYLYCGEVSVNGEPYSEDVYCNAEGTSMVIDWWNAAALPEARQNVISVTYANEAVSVIEGDSLVLTALHDTHLDAKNITFQWYKADAPEQWGIAVDGATDGTFAVPTDAVGDKYYHCHITAELDGKTISSPVSEFNCVKVTVKATPTKPMAFTDVKTSDWFYSDVQYAYENGLMNGVGSDKFDPNGNCTRAMIVTILYRMEAEPSYSGTNPFSDVGEGQWYTDAVVWAAENNIVNGVGHGKFEPNTNITREQLATILCRYAAYCGVYNKEDGAMLTAFADYDKVSDWAEDAMSWAVGVGLIGGSSEKDGLYLLPGGNALRCQVAAIFHRFCETLKKP